MAEKQKVMVNIVGVKRHEDKVVGEKETLMASFGFNVILAQDEATAEFKKDTFEWINTLVGVERGGSVIDAYEQIAKALAGDKKAIYSELTYHVNDKGYVVIDTLYRRDKKKEETKD